MQEINDSKALNEECSPNKCKQSETKFVHKLSILPVKNTSKKKYCTTCPVIFSYQDTCHHQIISALQFQKELKVGFINFDTNGSVLQVSPEHISALTTVTAA